MTQSKEYDAPSKIIKKEEMPPRASPFNPAAFNGIAQYFEDVQKKSKSPIGGGFRKINGNKFVTQNLCQGKRLKIQL